MKCDKKIPSTWKKFRPSLCQGCWAACCTLPVLVTSEELYHLGFLKFDEVNGPLGKIATHLKRKGITQSYNARTRHFTLAQRKNGDCVFLDENRLCKVYESRPSICREFPFNSKRPGYCPSWKK